MCHLRTALYTAKMDADEENQGGNEAKLAGKTAPTIEGVNHQNPFSELGRLIKKTYFHKN